MTKDTTVAARYARALFIVTEKRGETAAALEDLKAVGEMLKPGTPAARLVATPQVMLSDKRQAMKKTLGGKALPSVVLFADLLLRKKRLGELATIVSQFEALVERKQGIQRAHLTSAVPLTDAERDRVHAEVQKMTGKNIRMTTEVDSRLLGGAMVRIGDRVIDRSVRTLLDTMEQKLLETSV